MPTTFHLSICAYVGRTVTHQSCVAERAPFKDTGKVVTCGKAKRTTHAELVGAGGSSWASRKSAGKKRDIDGDSEADVNDGDDGEDSQRYTLGSFVVEVQHSISTESFR
jgi:hypothetical protein